MAMTVDFEIKQGSTYTHKFCYRYSDTKDPVDLTGYTVRMQMRPALFSDVVLFEADSAQGSPYLFILSPEEGTVLLDIPAAVTETFTFPNAVFDIEVEDNFGDVSRIAEGSVFISYEVTRG